MKAINKNFLSRTFKVLLSLIFMFISTLIMGRIYGVVATKHYLNYIVEGNYVKIDEDSILLKDKSEEQIEFGKEFIKEHSIIFYKNLSVKPERIEVYQKPFKEFKNEEDVVRFLLEQSKAKRTEKVYINSSKADKQYEFVYCKSKVFYDTLFLNFYEGFVMVNGCFYMIRIITPNDSNPINDILKIKEQSLLIKLIL